MKIAVQIPLFSPPHLSKEHAVLCVLVCFTKRIVLTLQREVQWSFFPCKLGTSVHQTTLELLHSVSKFGSQQKQQSKACTNGHLDHAVQLKSTLGLWRRDSKWPSPVPGGAGLNEKTPLRSGRLQRLWQRSADLRDKGRFRAPGLRPKRT